MHAANLKHLLSDPTLDEWTRASIAEVLDRLESDDYLTDNTITTEEDY